MTYRAHRIRARLPLGLALLLTYGLARRWALGECNASLLITGVCALIICFMFAWEHYREMRWLETRSEDE